MKKLLIILSLAFTLGACGVERNGHTADSCEFWLGDDHWSACYW